jgi:sugar lactone lactonase YvrE
MAAKLVFNLNSELLEGPVFDHDRNYLYFVSIFDCLVYCYSPKTKELLSMKLDTPVSCVYILGDKKVLASSKGGFYAIDFNNLKKEFVFQINIADNVRYNDGIQDPKGRYLIGTMGYPSSKQGVGEVFSYLNGEYKSIIKNTTISNGLAFSEDGSILYFIDTPTNKVAKYRYNLATGEATFDSYVIELLDKGSPDGMCMDKEGMLWIAEWGGGCISRWDPLTGKRIENQSIPCTNVTSCCLDTVGNLYITTAKSDTSADTHGGGLFYLELNKK